MTAGPGHPSTTGPAPIDLDHPSAADLAAEQRQRLWLFAGGAGLVAILGLVVVLVMVLSGNPDVLRGTPDPPPDDRPPLARACPPPPDVEAPRRGEAVPVTGPRTVDRGAGISYKAYGEPWEPWPTVWRAGTLEVPYAIGQHFVTEYYGGGTYHASILSAAVPAATNDALMIDLECVGKQVAADVRAEYYPQPNQMQPIREGLTEMGGLRAWVSVFRLRFERNGLKADNELAAVVCLDVGRPTAAVLYVSIPGTHKQYDWVVDDVLASVRPA